MEAARGATVKADEARQRVVRARTKLEQAQRELVAAERALHRWTAGAEGERQVAEVVSQLASEGWLALHDVHWPGRPKANLDHVLIGPGGVVVVDAKNWSGRVQVRHDGVLTCAGHPKSDAIASARDAAAAVAVFLEPPHRRLAVSALCFVGQDVPPRSVDGVWVMDRDHLAGWVRGLEPLLDHQTVLAVWGHLQRTLDGAVSPQLATTASVSHLGRRRTARAATGPRRSQQAPAPKGSTGAGRALLALVLVIVGVSLSCSLSGVLGSMVSDAFAPDPTGPAVDVEPAVPGGVVQPPVLEPVAPTP